MFKLKPLFDFTNDGTSILIYQSQAEVCINQKTYPGNGEVRLELLPKASIYIHGSFENIPSSSIVGSPEIASFSINGHQIKGFCLNSRANVDTQKLELKWCPESEPIYGIGNESSKMTFLMFHLFNFVDFYGTRRSQEKCGSATHSIQHVDLTFDEWKIELKSLTSTQENIKTLKEKGGYRLTHMVGIKKTDDTFFTGKDSTDCLEALLFFLSFAKGGWCKPICAVGFDTSDNRVWESWSSPRETWRRPVSWFNKGAQLASLFPGFMKKWKNSDWREALHEVIYWYLNANFSSHGIDAGIILTQAAIERLSYEYVVKDKGLLIADGFKNLRASDKFRLLFSSLGIPLEIQEDTPDIKQLAPKFNWQDAPHALTEIRNSLIHPEHKKRNQLDSTYYDAWNLGLWYLEMGLLAICDYSGDYGNRLLKGKYVGEVEEVPWTKK